MVSLLQVCQDDEEFQYQVYACTRADEFAPLGWSEPQLEALLRMQFGAQQRSYAMQYPAAEQRIVAVNRIRVGHLIVHDGSDALVLVYVALLPEHRNRGTGSELIRELQQRAFELEKPLRLQVLADSPARRLYERLGFSETALATPYVAMEWNPK